MKIERDVCWRTIGLAQNRMFEPTSDMDAHLILFVESQEQSTEFFSAVLDAIPRLNVPGMTEFELGPNTVLGLMPRVGFRKLVDLPEDRLPNRVQVNAELYLVTPNAREYHKRALGAGAKELSPFLKRSWGDTAGYSMDADGNVLAFARR